MSVSFLHTADWQIAKAFARLPEDASVHLRQQRIDTIKTIAGVAVERSVDAVVVAGDVYDMPNVSDKTIRLVINAMSTFKGPWLLIPGNHDPGTPESVWTQMRRLGIPDNIKLIDKPEPFWLNEETVVLPAPLLRKHEATDPTQWFDNYSTETNVIRIGLAHGSVDNRLPDRGDAPNTISDRRAETATLDYLALGDWHGCMQIGKKTWYSGTHETDRFRTNDSGNILHVSVAGHGSEPVVIPIRVGHYRWHQVNPNIFGEFAHEDLDKALEALAEPFDNLVLQICPRGSAGLEIKHKIADVVANWEARVRYLEFDDRDLVTKASEDELNEIGGAGFMVAAVNRLRTIMGDPTHADHQYAELALQLLYSEHKLAGGKR